jgi:hypothetical protein
MNSYIIDTNVLIVANDKHMNASFKDVFECQQFLNNLKNEGKQLSIDSLGLIFKEYFTHDSRSGQPGIGDAFAKWFFSNQWNNSICEQVDITPDIDGTRGFLEFPEDDSLANFDMDDPKFAAVAISSRFDAVICNACDSDWWDFKGPLEKFGINIKFLCPELIKKN